MTQDRNVRRWHGDAAVANDLDEERHWVVWGTGALADEVLAEPETGNDVARKIAEGHDPEWADDHGWVVIVEGDEDDIDVLAQDEETVRGYAPYLIEREAAGSAPRVMSDRLHGDRVKRRPFSVGKRR